MDLGLFVEFGKLKQNMPVCVMTKVGIYEFRKEKFLLY